MRSVSAVTFSIFTLLLSSQFHSSHFTQFQQYNRFGETKFHNKIQNRKKNPNILKLNSLLLHLFCAVFFSPVITNAREVQQILHKSGCTSDSALPSARFNLGRAAMCVCMCVRAPCVRLYILWLDSVEVRIDSVMHPPAISCYTAHS